MLGVLGAARGPDPSQIQDRRSCGSRPRAAQHRVRGIEVLEGLQALGPTRGPRRMGHSLLATDSSGVPQGAGLLTLLDSSAHWQETLLHRKQVSGLRESSLSGPYA